MPILPSIIAQLIEHETNPLRFEAFTRDVYSAAEGVVLVPTSQTYDLGRDGRTISARKRAFDAVLCATLDAKINAKVARDIERLAATTHTDAIIYCSSQQLTEHACDLIEAEIRVLYPDVTSVRVLSQIQLVALGEQHEAVVRKHYPGEIHNLNEVFFGGQTEDAEPETVGLRLALLTQTGDDAVLLRSELTQRLILELLVTVKTMTSAGVATKISAQLHLPRTISSAFVDERLAELERNGLVTGTDEKFAITQEGREYVRVIPAEAPSKLLEGRAVVRKALVALSGHVFSDPEFERVWNTFQDGIAEAFYAHGAAIVRMVAAIGSSERIQETNGERMLRERLADRIAEPFSNPDLRDEIRQAVIDLFSEKDSEAFAWLSETCSVFVMLCSLGLENKSNAQVVKVLRGIRLLPDTDILLSLLCEGERNHPEVHRVIGAWNALGGEVYSPQPALEEVAYHAWIALPDFEATLDLPLNDDAAAERLISNTFVRTFRKLSGSHPSKRAWNDYIEQYRGRNARDYAKIAAILREEFHVDRLTSTGEADTSSGSFFSAVRDFMVQSVASEAEVEASELDYRTLDKCRRDALLIVALRTMREDLYKQGANGTVIALSSARLLKQADSRFRDELGQPDAVISLAAVATLLVLTPGVNMGVGTLRGVLFDLNLAKRLSPMQRYAYRLVASTEGYQMPWSKRVTLRRRLGERLLNDAKASDKPVQYIQRKILNSEDPEYSARIVKDAFDKMAIRPDTRELIEAQRRQIDELQEEIKRLTAKRRPSAEDTSNIETNASAARAIRADKVD